MPRALLSTHDTTGLERFARGLTDLGWQIVATPDTASFLRDAGLHVMDVMTLTKDPELLGGRISAMHPSILAGILARDLAEELTELRGHRIPLIDLVVCNLYPFRETITLPGVSLGAALEQIDIGGVALLRAAARNFERVIVLCDHSDYHRVLSVLRAGGEVDADTRRRLAAKAFALTRNYDTAIHAFLLGVDDTEPLPDAFSMVLWRLGEVRAENPQQAAALYAPVPDAGPLGGKLLAGPPLSYGVVFDLDIALRAVAQFDEPAVAIARHGQLTGLAIGQRLADALPRAVSSDPVSAAGAVIAVNRHCDQALVAALGDLFIQAIAAPDFDPAAREELTLHRQNCDLLRVEPPSSRPLREIRSLRHGVLMQTPDPGDPPDVAWVQVSKRKPTRQEETAMRFAWKVIHHVRTSAIVIATPSSTVGIGSASNRLDAIRLALYRAGDRAQGAVMAGDNFFDFPDGVEMAAEAGVTAVIQPGGALRDPAVIAAADGRDMAMVFTRVSHVLH